MINSGSQSVRYIRQRPAKKTKYDYYLNLGTGSLQDGRNGGLYLSDRKLLRSELFANLKVHQH